MTRLYRAISTHQLPADGRCNDVLTVGLPCRAGAPRFNDAENNRSTKTQALFLPRALPLNKAEQDFSFAAAAAAFFDDCSKTGETIAKLKKKTKHYLFPARDSYPAHTLLKKITKLKIDQHCRKLFKIVKHSPKQF